MVGAVIPWNFPLLMAAWKIAPALACGNTVVLKPAETTPLTALVLAEIAAEAGLPAGVLNVLPGAGDVGAALVGHAGLDKVAFTGSTEVGKQIQRRLAGTGRRLTLELGGKAANIVYDDAPLDQAVEGVIDGIFFNQGHVCCAGSRLLVQESIAEEFAELLRRRIETLRVGDPLDKNTDVGAINSAAQLDRIVELAAAGDAEGARRWTSPCPLPERGLFFPPTVFSGSRADHAGGPRGDLRPGAVGADLPHPGRGGGQGQQHPVRAVRRDLDGEGVQGAVDRAAAARRGGVDQHLQPLRPDRPVRRLPASPASAARAGWPGWPPTWPDRRLEDVTLSAPVDGRLGVAKTYKLYLGGAFPRSESGRSYPVHDAKGRLLAHAALASRKDLRDAVGAARAAFGGWSGATAYNRGQVLYRVAEMLQARHEQFVDDVVAAEGVRREAGRPRWWTRRSTAGSGTPAGPTRSPACSAR